MNRGYFFFTAPIGGEIPCWSSPSSTASVPPITRAGADAASPNGVDVEEKAPTSAVNNVVFSRHYPVDDPKALSVGAEIGIGLGVAVPASAAISALTYYLLRKRRQRKARRRMQAYGNSLGGIWDGPHASGEHLFRGSPQEQELHTFKPSTVNRMASARTRDSVGYDGQQERYFDPHRQFTRHSRGNSYINQDPNYTGFPPPVLIPPRVSSRSATFAGNVSPAPIPPARMSSFPVSNTGNPWGAAVDTKGVAPREGSDPKSAKPNGEKERDALQNAGGASTSVVQNSLQHGDQQQQHRQSQHTPEIAGHPVVGHQGRGSGDALEDVDIQEPPPEYRE